MKTWEFKPAWLRQYIVLLPTLLVNGIRYRNLTTFTATNPDIPHSGFFGESKVDILDKLSLTSSKFVASYRFLPPNSYISERLNLVKDFIQAEDLNWPVILKPDIGQRGQGVALVYNEQEVLNYLESHSEALIVQKYIAGAEYSVFYIRHPESKTGNIYCITEKLLPKVIGNARDTVLQLVRADPWLSLVEHRLPFLPRVQNQIPKTGEPVFLGHTGAHSSGARCLDATFQFCTLELTQRIDEISQAFGKFYFGRYDIRVNAPDALRTAQDFYIIELNGVTSEPLHIYDPGYTIWDNYRVIIELWNTACRIGAYNSRSGISTTPIGEVIRLWRIYG